MRKTIRPKVTRAKLEKLILKYQRRIKKMSESVYEIRQIIEQYDEQKINIPTIVAVDPAVPGNDKTVIGSVEVK